MRVFVGNLSSALGSEIAKQLKTCEVVGAVENIKQTQSMKKKLVENRDPDLSPSDESNPFIENPVVVYADKHNVSVLLKRCDVAIYSILDDPDGVVDALRAFEEGAVAGDEPKLFIAISSVLTWAKTPDPTPLPEEWIGHREETFKQRKPARKYAAYKSIETQVLSAKRDGLKTLVIASGLIYGGAQSSFYHLLRDAWLHPEDDLIVPSISNLNGSNLLPMINLYDLAKIVAKASQTSIDTTYMLAVDKSNTSLREICLAISKTLGNGRIRDIDSNEAEELLLKEKAMTHLQLNLRFDTTGSAIENLEIEWNYINGFVDNIDIIIDDYIKCMDLRPLRIVILGPPQVGKTILSTTLAQTYYLPHLTRGSIANDILNKTNLDDTLVPLREEIKKYRLNLNELPQEYLIELFRWKLKSPICRNQGYILDGIPYTIEQTKSIFSIPLINNIQIEENEEKKNDEKINEINFFVPNRVIVLDTIRNVLEKRAQELTENDAEKTGNNEIEFNKKYELYQNEKNNIFLYFEKKNNIEILELQFENEEMFLNKKYYYDPITKYIEQNGKPYNFHPTKDEIKNIQKEIEKKLAMDIEIEQKKQNEKNEKERNEKQTRALTEKSRLEFIQREEMDILEARSKPLRAYLMETVIPVLTEGMLEVVKVQPDDPIDYLADFLFKKGQDYIF